MSKIQVVGRAEKEFTADQCVISFSVEARENTAARASKAVMEESERFLEQLDKLGIKTEMVVLKDDDIDRGSRYNDNRDYYDSKRKMEVEVPLDMKLINWIRKTIEEGFENISMDVRFQYSKSAEANKQLLTAAIKDSKEKAELLASTMGSKITGIDSANLSGRDDLDEDDNDEDEYCDEDDGALYLSCQGFDASIADKLKATTVSYSTEVKIVWLME